MPKSRTLYGRKYVIHNFHNNGQIERIEREYVTIKAEEEIPSQLMLSPIDLDYMLRQFRMEKYDHEINN
jgi:hypothetical protein